MADTQPSHEQYRDLIERHKALIERLCMSRALGDYHRCAELRQECYISIWRHQPSLRPDATAQQEAVWVYWQCRSAFSRRRLLQRANLVSLDQAPTAAVIAAAEPDPYGGLDLEPFADMLTPHEFRALALMAEGYSPGEMASILGIKPRSAIQLRHRIITKLRKYHQPKK